MGNVVVLLNLLPRTIAVIKHDEKGYGLSATSKIEAKLKKQISRRFTKDGSNDDAVEMNRNTVQSGVSNVSV